MIQESLSLCTLSNRVSVHNDKLAPISLRWPTSIDVCGSHVVLWRGATRDGWPWGR